MKFVDEAKIYVRGGHGGAGCVSFRREKFVPKGGPDGGDGGKGGDVIIRADRSHHTLLDLKYQQHQFAKNGGHGSGNNRTGRSAEDLIVIVPPGTIVKDFETGDILADLARATGEPVLLFGRAGRGALRLGLELLYRQCRLARIIHEFQPDLILAVGGAFVE